MSRAGLLALAAVSVLSAAPVLTRAEGRASVRVPASEAQSLRQPHMTRVPGTNVFVKSDPGDRDVFRYDGYWYLFSNGYWFRARSYNAAFSRWDARRVPRPVMNVPAQYWRDAAEAPSTIARREEPVDAKDKKHERTAGD